MMRVDAEKTAMMGVGNASRVITVRVESMQLLCSIWLEVLSACRKRIRKKQIHRQPERRFSFISLS
ncbi:hypothetical protein AAH450_10010 [Erwinia sp. P7711]|uniref:hypothetical protein n=1 Tax=Erwinia sp. P7711 TaxID=3141451 RepID=UPI003193016C